MNEATAKKQVWQNAERVLKERIQALNEQLKRLQNVSAKTVPEGHIVPLQSETAASHEVTDKLLRRSKQTANQLARLQKLARQEKDCDCVEPAALVTTNQGTFLVAVPTGKFTVNNTEIHGLSTQSPLYRQMRGLRAGDHFHLNNTPYVIEVID